MGSENPKRRDELLDKLKEKTISEAEAKELKNILEEEKKVADAKRNTILALRIAFVIGLVIAFLATIEDDESMKKDKSKPEKSASDSISKMLDETFK